jgi:predicted outer membrane repeat protein
MRVNPHVSAVQIWKQKVPDSFPAPQEMRRRFGGSALLMALVVLILAAGVCQANDITYYVYLTLNPIDGGGPETVTGTIVTDGNLGVLSSSDIVSYSLEFSGASSGPFTDPENGSYNVTVEGSALTATATQLNFNFNGTNSYVYLADNINDIPRLVACSTGSYEAVCGGVGIGDGSSFYLTSESGTQVIAATSISICDASHLQAAVASGGAITFSCSGTITLTSPLTISQDTTIDGTGQSVTISGGGTSQVLSISAGVNVTLKNLTISDGQLVPLGAPLGEARPRESAELFGWGGAIYNDGTLNIVNCTFSDNTAEYGGAIYNDTDGILTVSGGTFSNNKSTGNAVTAGTGGAIDNEGTLTISSSTFSSNTAVGFDDTECGGYFYCGAGGAIYNDGTLAISGSTLSGNSVSGAGAGGAIYSHFLSEESLLRGQAPARAVRSTADRSIAHHTTVASSPCEDTSGCVYVVNSTLTNNNSYLGGGLYNSSDATVYTVFTTFWANIASSSAGGGNIFNQLYATFEPENTIIAGSSESGGNCLNSDGGSLRDLGYNLSDDSSCALTASTTVITTSPQLGSLANNGGPTQTIALASTSPALNRVMPGTNNCGAGATNPVTTDERGMPRPQGTGCDIGAYELDMVTIAPVSPLSGEVGAAYGPVAFSASAGLGPYTWSVTPGAGLSLTTTTGASTNLSGTPTASSASVTMTDSFGGTAHVSIPIVAHVGIASPTALPSGEVGVPYGPITFSASPGMAPYTWSVTGPLTMSSGGVLSGTPSAGFSGSIAVTVKDSLGGTATVSYSLSIGAHLSMSCTTAGPVEVRLSYSASCQAAGGLAPYRWGISSGSLPAGLNLSGNAGSASVSGAPLSQGNYSYVITVTDSAGQTASQAYSGTIAGQPSITGPASLPAGTVNVAYGPVSFSATYGTPPYSWYGSGLPSGLAVSTAGVLSGTPATGTQGTYNMQVTLVDAAQATVIRTFPITINAPVTVTTTSAPVGTVGTPYSASLSASGGVPPYSNWTVSGTLPPGLSLSASGVISGTPTTNTGSPFTFSVTVQDSSGITSPAQALSITISGGILSITTTSLPNATVGSSYSQSLTAKGGTPPYTWSISGLPGGLTGSSSGVISGTPAVGGSFTVSAMVKDSTGASAPSATIKLSVTIATLMITTGSLPGGPAGDSYQATVSATGGVPPYSWSVAGSSAFTISGSGVLSSQALSSGTTSLTVQVTDSQGKTASEPFTITATGTALTLTGSLPSGIVGSAYSQTLTVSGGTQPYTWGASGLPQGLSMNASTGAITGTPTAAGSYPVTVTVTDSTSPTKLTFSQQYTITITSPAQNVTITLETANSLPNQATLSVTFGQTAANFTGTLSLSFAAAPSVTNVPASYTDCSAGFPGSSGTAAATNYPYCPAGTPVLTTNFTVAGSSADLASVPFAEGTVAGTWTVTLTALTDANGNSVMPTPPPTATVAVTPAAPVIESVQITGVTSSGFVVQINGYSDTRALTSGTFQFSPSSGATLQGSTATVAFNGADQSGWFGLSTSLPFGGNFSLGVPFSFSGDTSALGTVTVTLANTLPSGGEGTSAPVTGSQ